MRYLPLIWSGIWRKPGRSILIFLQVSVAFTLFGVLQGMKSGVEQLIGQARADLLLVHGSLGLVDSLPLGGFDLRIEVRREQQAIEEIRPLNGILSFVSYFVGAIMAIGATLGAVNSLYAMVDARHRDIATLRAIGFKSGPVIVAVLLESMLLALPGALLGSLLAWVLFNGLAASPFGYSFRLSVTFSLALLGIEWALAMGLLGGLLPALRAVRMPIVTALRAI